MQSQEGNQRGLHPIKPAVTPLGKSRYEITPAVKVDAA